MNRTREAEHLPIQALSSGCLSHVPNVHCDLGAPAERLGVEQENDGRLKQTADGGVHLRADHHHALAKTNYYMAEYSILKMCICATFQLLNRMSKIDCDICVKVLCGNFMPCLV